MDGCADLHMCVEVTSIKIYAFEPSGTAYKRAPVDCQPISRPRMDENGESSLGPLGSDPEAVSAPWFVWGKYAISSFVVLSSPQRLR